MTTKRKVCIWVLGLASIIGTVMTPWSIDKKKAFSTNRQSGVLMMSAIGTRWTPVWNTQGPPTVEYPHRLLQSFVLAKYKGEPPILFGSDKFQFRNGDEEELAGHPKLLHYILQIVIPLIAAMGLFFTGRNKTRTTADNSSSQPASRVSDPTDSCGC